MSTGTRQWFHHWLDVRSAIEPYPLTWNSFPLCPADARTWKDAVLLLGILCEDLGFCKPCSTHSRRMVKSICKCDIVELMTAFKEADRIITSYWGETPGHSLNSAFKQLLTVTSVRRAFKLIYPFVVEFLYSGDLQLFSRVHQYFAFLSHISFRDIPEGDEIESFVNTDASLTIEDPRIPVRLNAIAKEWFRDFTITARPSLSNGATYECSRAQQVEKWAFLFRDARISTCFSDSGLDPADYYPYDRFDEAPRVNRLLLVPKTVLKRRTICPEPTFLQWVQQLVKRSLDDHFQRVLRGHIDLKHPERNSRLACEGSTFGYFSTIDLSAASDSVSNELVERVFADTPLLPWLRAARSEYTELPDGRKVELKKYATMGSALCFPVECIIFALLCEDAARVMGRRSQYSVYGDDIVIETEIVPMLVRHLLALSFKVNADKSFWLNKMNVFRESCGGEYVGGHSVAPWRLSRWFAGVYVDPEGDPNGVPRMVDAINMAHQRGFYRVRRWLSAAFAVLPKYRHPGYAYPGTTAIWTYYPTSICRGKYGEPSVESVRYTVPPGLKLDEVNPQLALWHWFNRASEREPDWLGFFTPVTPVANPGSGRVTRKRVRLYPSAPFRPFT